MPFRQFVDGGVSVVVVLPIIVHSADLIDEPDPPQVTAVHPEAGGLPRRRPVTALVAHPGL